MFGEKVERALRAAVEAHQDQFRKGLDGVPYVTHPMHVALILARRGMDEDLIVAGLLHDVVEDCQAWPLERVAAEFGAHVKSIVEQLTEDRSQGWEERKQAAIDRIPRMSPEAASVKAVDKLHNLQTLLADLLGQEAIRAQGLRAAETARLLKASLGAMRQELAGVDEEELRIANERGRLQGAEDRGARHPPPESPGRTPRNAGSPRGAAPACRQPRATPASATTASARRGRPRAKAHACAGRRPRAAAVSARQANAGCTPERRARRTTGVARPAPPAPADSSE